MRHSCPVCGASGFDMAYGGGPDGKLVRCLRCDWQLVTVLRKARPDENATHDREAHDG